MYLKAEPLLKNKTTAEPYTGSEGQGKDGSEIQRVTKVDPVFTDQHICKYSDINSYAFNFLDCF